MFLNKFIKILLSIGVAVCLLPARGIAQQKPEEPKEQKGGEKSEFPLDHFYVKRHKRIISILHNFHIGASIGYGNTTFSHDLKGFSIYQPKGGQPTIFTGTSPTVRYTNWVSGVARDSSVVKPGGYSVNSDTAKIGFKGKAFSIPLRLTIHYEFGGRYRIGAGYSYEYMSIGPFHPTALSNKISDFKLPNPSGFMSKYFIMAGASFYRYDEYLFIGDINIGNYKPHFTSPAITTGMYYNLGVTVERDFSEYLKGFIRPSYEFKSYTLALPESSKSISHGMNAAYISIGFTYSIPPIPRCFLKDCHIQINHAHGNKEYRSRRHPIYKKQNPGYGENFPKLIKYKGKNKNKLNPY